jgi:hypothetical protein
LFVLFSDTSLVSCHHGRLFYFLVPQELERFCGFVIKSPSIYHIYCSSLALKMNFSVLAKK